MYSKIIKIGDSCNNNCDFCFEKQNKYAVDFVLIKKELENGRKEKCEQVIFTGREPTVVNKIIDLVEYAKQLDYKVIQLMSNARLFSYKKFTEDMIKAGLTELVVPIYHYQGEVHDQITGVKDSWAQTISGIENVVKFSAQNSPYFNVFVSVGIVLCKENLKDLSGIIKFLQQKGIKQIFIINNKIAKIDNLEQSLLKLKPCLENNDSLIYLVGFKKLPVDLEKYSYENLIQLNKKNFLLAK